jgi:hypothetical protein
MPKSILACEFCGKCMATSKGVRSHQSQSIPCREALGRLIQSFNITAFDNDVISEVTSTVPNIEALSLDPNDQETVDYNNLPYYEPESELSSQNYAASVEDAEDDGDIPQRQTQFVESFEEEAGAGDPVSTQKRRTNFEKLRDEKLNATSSGSDRMWGLFADQDD